MRSVPSISLSSILRAKIENKINYWKMQMCKINGQNMKLDVIKDAEINEFCMKIVKSLSESP